MKIIKDFKYFIESINNSEIREIGVKDLSEMDFEIISLNKEDITNLDNLIKDIGVNAIYKYYRENSIYNIQINDSNIYFSISKTEDDYYIVKYATLTSTNKYYYIDQYDNLSIFLKEKLSNLDNSNEIHQAGKINTEEYHNLITDYSIPFNNDEKENIITLISKLLNGEIKVIDTDEYPKKHISIRYNNNLEKIEIFKLKRNEFIIKIEKKDGSWYYYAIENYISLIEFLKTNINYDKKI